MNRNQLVQQIFAKRSYLCIGLDTDIEKLPPHLAHHPDAVFTFNTSIIDATKDHCVAYKINTAFYEAWGAKGWEVMERTVDYIGEGHFRIADAKRGDIGNTSNQYARAFFETMPFDAVTVAPYMGEDSVKPFLQHKGKWGIILGLTSNKGAADFELQRVGEKFLYEEVLEKCSHWGNAENMMFVIGATRPAQFEKIRELLPRHFFLVPGVGAQGGDLELISRFGLNKDGGLLVNVSRDILFASAAEDFAASAGEKAKTYATQMTAHLQNI